MGSRVDEQSDISDSEINEYKELVYKLLKFRTYKIRDRNGKFRCPFCAIEEEQDYRYNHLLRHATRVAEGSTQSAKQRANHFAMVKYLVDDLADEAEPLPQSVMPSPAAEGDDDRTGFKIDRSRKKGIDRKTYVGSRIHDSFAADDDNQSEGHVGEYLRKKGASRTISDNDMKSLETETRKLQRITQDHIKRVLEEQEMLNLELEKKRRRLDSWSKELDKHEAVIECERLKLELEKTKNDSRNNMLQMAEKLREAEENYQMMVERLKEKEAELLKLKKDLYCHLGLQECQNNDEFQDVRTELIKLLIDMPSHSCVDIGVKRIREIDENAFKDACKKKFPSAEAEIKAAELCNFCAEKLRKSVLATVASYC